MKECSDFHVQNEGEAHCLRCGKRLQKSHGERIAELERRVALLTERTKTMGNWRTVRVVGTCADITDQGRLRAALAVDYMDDSWDCLCSGGLCGLPNFGKAEFDVTGNLAERDYEPESVAEHLLKLAKVAPSLECVIHCGGDYEETNCIATVVCVGGETKVTPPMVEDIGEIPRIQVERNMLIMMLGGRTW